MKYRDNLIQLDLPGMNRKPMTWDDERIMDYNVKFLSRMRHEFQLGIIELCKYDKESQKIGREVIMSFNDWMLR